MIMLPKAGIFTKVPLRISIAGGGTDLPTYYLDRGLGEVINFPINKYMFIASSDYFDPNATNFKYSEVETVSNLDNFKNPIVREVLKKFSTPHGLHYASLSSVPGGTGLGSSSAFCVGLISNVAKRMGRQLSQYEAAEIACHIELEILKEPIGKQDQFGCAIGGLKHLIFKKSSVVVEGLPMTHEMEDELTKHLVLIRVGGIRSASQILSDIQSDKKVNLKKLDEIRGLVPAVKSALARGDIGFLGKNLHENWMIKKNLNKSVSNIEIDKIYEDLVPKKAHGGKLLGAGGSGFLLFILKQPLSETKLPDGVSFSEIQIDKEGVISTTL